MQSANLLRRWCLNSFTSIFHHSDLKDVSSLSRSSVVNVLSSEDGAMDSFSPLFINIAEDTVRSLKYLHDNNIAHRDLQPGNVLVSNQMYCEMPNKEALREAWEKEPIICKLVDFGESRASMIQTATVCSTQTTNIDRGTPIYMAPELLSPVDTSLSLEHLKACEIWSYGVWYLVVWYGYIHVTKSWPAVSLSIWNW